MNATSFAARQHARAHLDQDAARLAKNKLVDLFAGDANSVASLSCESPHLLADSSKQRIDAAALADFNQLADTAGFDDWRAKMFAGEIVNNTEHRPAMHWALRAADAPAEVKATQAKMAA